MLKMDKNLKRNGNYPILLSNKLGWRTQSKFQMGLHKRDLYLLLQQYLGGIGSIYKNPILNKVNYSIDSKKDLKSLINHLEKYPLLTQKAADFILFKEIIELMNNKVHLSINGLQQIINLKASMNLDLSDFLKSEFNNIIPVIRQFINTKYIPDSDWIAGFVTGEGNFDIRITEQNSNKIKYRVQLRFRISQHERDRKLMECLINYFGSGKLYKYPGKPAVVLMIFNFTDITNIIIPSFLGNDILY